MAYKTLVTALVGAGLAYLFLEGTDEEEKEKIPPGGVEDKPYSQCLDEDMPPAVKKLVLNALKQVTNPADLDKHAETAAKAGFPMAAACLKQKADELRGKGDKPKPKPEPPDQPSTLETPTPFQIRPGDFPFAVAQYYTGQGERFKELRDINPHLGSLHIDPYTNTAIYSGWLPGTWIILPPAWKGSERPYPIPGTQNPSHELPPKVPPIPIPVPKGFKWDDWVSSILSPSQ